MSMDKCGLCGELLGVTFHTCTPKIVKVYSEEQYESLHADRDSWRRVAEALEREKVDVRRERDEARQAFEDMRSAKDTYREQAMKWRRIATERKQANAALLNALQNIKLLTIPTIDYRHRILRIANELLAQYDTAQPTAIQLRPALQWFAIVMEQTLRRNDHKGGWNDCTMQYLYEKLDEEVGELSACLSDEEVIKEAADVANFAMMIADIARRSLSPQKGETPGDTR